MFTMFFMIMMFAVFGRLLGFALRAGWGLLRLLLTFLFLPGIILFGLFSGMLWLSLPLLLLSGAGALAGPGRRFY